MRKEKEARRPDFKETCQVFIGLALLLGGSGLLHAPLPNKSSQGHEQVAVAKYRWGRAEGRTAGGLFRITGKEDPYIADQPLPEKLKPFFFYPMNINLVSADLLRTVPGIGEKLAGSIIRRRQKQGGFHDLDELGRIDGIGPKKLARLEEFLTCDSSPILLK